MCLCVYVIIIHTVYLFTDSENMASTETTCAVTIAVHFTDVWPQACEGIKSVLPYPRFSITFKLRNKGNPSVILELVN